MISYFNIQIYDICARRCFFNIQIMISKYIKYVYICIIIDDISTLQISLNIYIYIYIFTHIYLTCYNHYTQIIIDVCLSKLQHVQVCRQITWSELSRASKALGSLGKMWRMGVMGVPQFSSVFHVFSWHFIHFSVGFSLIFHCKPAILGLYGLVMTYAIKLFSSHDHGNRQSLVDFASDAFWNPPLFEKPLHGGLQWILMDCGG